LTSGSEEKSLLLVFDEKLTEQSKVLLKGIRECLTGPVLVHCIVSTSVDDRQKAELLLLAKKINLQLTLIEEIMPWEKFSSQARSPIAYQKFLWELLIKDLPDKLLYLDIDIVPIKNFDELFLLDFKAAFAAVALDDRISKKFKRWSMTANGGTVLFNINKWKIEGLTKSAITFIASNTKSNLYADLVLNKIYYDKWSKLNPRYNSTYAKTFQLSYLGVKSGISLVHFMGPRKPWKRPLITPLNAHIMRTYNRRQSEVSKILSSQE
jgi:lipopolysaccharide biosynthesis glycosyltransferase